MRILSIDNSVLTYIAWYRMDNANFRNVTNSREAEFTRNYAEIMTYVTTLYAPDKTFILMDSTVPIWRDKIQLDYYLKYAKVWIHKDNVYKHLLHFDDRYIPLRLDTARLEWIKEKNTTQKERSVEGWWNQWTECSLDEQHIEFLPHYKGNRPKEWKYETSKPDFKKLANTVAYKFAPFIDGIVLQEDTMEADDIAYLVAKLYPDDEHIMATTDRDWQQLAMHRNVSFYDPKEHVFVQKNPTQAKFDFYVKLIGGDGGDNIQGSMIENVKTGKAKKYAEKGAANLLNEMELSDAWQWMKDNMSPSLERNILLISLKRGYLHLQSYLDMRKIIGDVHRKGVDPKTLEIADFNTTQLALRMAGNEAKRDRAKCAPMLEFK